MTLIKEIKKERQMLNQIFNFPFQEIGIMRESVIIADMFGEDKKSRRKYERARKKTLKNGLIDEDYLLELAGSYGGQK